MIKVPAWSDSVKDCICSLQMAISLLCTLMVFPKGVPMGKEIALSSSSYKSISPIGLGPHPDARI